MSASNPAAIWMIISIIGIAAYNLVDFESMGLSKLAINLVRLITLVFVFDVFGMMVLIL
jgi:hypothetical protein